MRITDAFFRNIPNIVQNLDYGDRTDGQPDYMGYAAYGTSESTKSWVIIKFTYDDSGNTTKTESLGEKAWSLRASYFS